MKKLLFPLFAIIFLVSCSGKEQYLLKGELEGAAGELIFLQEYRDGKLVNIDSTALVSGSFEFSKGSVDIPAMYYLSIEGKRGSLGFFLENSEITVSGHVDTIYNAVTEGSVVNDHYMAYLEGLNSFYERSNSLYLEYRAAQQENNTMLSEEILAKRESIASEISSYNHDFIQKNTSSYDTPYILRSISYNLGTDELDAYLELLDASLSESPVVSELRLRVEALRKVEVGQTAPDFTQDDIEGNPVTLSEIKGHKLLLVDFWAAWCGPCRVENPNLVAVYNDYNDSGFDVLGVSLDNEREAWLQAIEDDQLPWTQVSDLGGWSNSVAILYAVNSIPANFLLDAEGKILARGLRGDKLRTEVARLLAE